MSLRKQAGWVLAAIAPGVIWVVLSRLAWWYIATWDRRPGAPQAPIEQRLLVATANWATRYLPFIGALAGLVLPVVVLLVGRRLAASQTSNSLERTLTLWLLLAIVAAAAAYYLSLAIVTPSQLVELQVVHWTAWCLGCAAAANAYGLLTTSGRARLRTWAMLALWAAFLLLGTYGIVAGLAALQLWLASRRGAGPRAA